MKKTAKLAFKIAASIIGLVCVVFIGLSIFLSTLDADKYRPQLAAAINKQTGRTAKLNGPIKFSLGLSGVHVSVQDASISNPSWASRPVMAGMGKFELAVGLLPLLDHELSINELSIENADILLETNAAGQHNYDFTPAIVAPAADKNAPATAQTSASTGASLSIDSLSITNSQLALRSADGHISSYNVASLTLKMGASGAEIKFKGDIDAAPLTMDVKTSMKDLLSQAAFTFDADIQYSAIHIAAEGKADVEHKTANVTSYEVAAGKTKLGGELSANWGGARPNLKGNLKADYINPADFKAAAAGSEQGAPKPESQPAKKSGPMFGSDPLPLASLKSADANLDVAVGEFAVGLTSLKKVSAKLALANGDLTLDPVSAEVGTVPAAVHIRLNATQLPAHLLFGLTANGVDLGELQKLASMSPFMSGKASADIQLAGDGISAHDFASSLGGIIIITAEKGQILTGAAAGVSAALAAIFNPQGGNSALNCLAARFIVKNGVMNDNGILIDSSASEVSGKGNINLGAEAVNLVLHAKTKLVDVGGLVPALQISGPLNNPGYSVDAVGTVTNAVNGLLNGNADILSSSVPDIQAAPAGQNACVYTLDHPKAVAQSTILPAGVTGRASQQIQNLGNSLVKGLFGK